MVEESGIACACRRTSSVGPTIATAWRRSRPACRGDAPRRGSLERPVNGAPLPRHLAARRAPAPARRVHRRTAGAAARAAARCRRRSTVDAACDARVASSRGLYPDRVPGPPGAAAQPTGCRPSSAPYGFTVVPDRFRADIPGAAQCSLQNRRRRCPGARRDAIVVMAHRDDNGTRAGRERQRLRDGRADRARARLRRRRSAPRPAVRPAAHARLPLDRRRRVRRARRRAASPRLAVRGRRRRRHRPDAIAGRGPPRLVLAGDRPRSPASGLVETAAQRVLEQTGDAPAGTRAARGS